MQVGGTQIRTRNRNEKPFFPKHDSTIYKSAVSMKIMIFRNVTLCSLLD